MQYPELNRGDKGDSVKQLQSLLNRVGAMLTADGDFGGGSERGVRYAQDIAQQPVTGTADEALWQWLLAQPEPYSKLASDGIAFIAAEETGGLGYYDKITQWPHYPGQASGITIGVGYDLRFNTDADFLATWGQHLDTDTIKSLQQDIGQKGTAKRANELKQQGILVPFKAAWPVFVHKTLPRFYELTLGIYPSLETLPDLCRSVLVSLVFNRGSSLDGPSRKEMRAIRDILASAASSDLNKPKRKMLLTDVEDELVAMQRLWGAGSGLAKRRQAEANLWRQGLHAW